VQHIAEPIGYARYPTIEERPKRKARQPRFPAKAIGNGLHNPPDQIEREAAAFIHGTERSCSNADPLSRFFGAAAATSRRSDRIWPDNLARRRGLALV